MPPRPGLLRRPGRAQRRRSRAARDWPRRHRAPSPPTSTRCVVTAAGCGSSMKDHPQAGPPVLDAAGVPATSWACAEPLRSTAPVTAVYQDACHLAHAQQVTRGAAAPAAAGRRPHARATGRRRAVLRLGRTLQHRAARRWPPNWARARPRRSSRRGRARRHRQHRLPDAARRRRSPRAVTRAGAHIDGGARHGDAWTALSPAVEAS